MKILRRYTLNCVDCGKDQHWCETESDLGFVDQALTLWCACDPKLVVNVARWPMGPDQEPDDESR